MTIHAMFVNNKKTLIDKILYDDIFNYLDDQGEHNNTKGTKQGAFSNLYINTCLIDV